MHQPCLLVALLDQIECSSKSRHSTHLNTVLRSVDVTDSSCNHTCRREGLPLLLDGILLVSGLCTRAVGLAPMVWSPAEHRHKIEKLSLESA